MCRYVRREIKKNIKNKNHEFKIVLPAMAGLGLTLFAFKPVPNSKITRLENGNFELKGVNISNTDLKALNELANSTIFFKQTVTKSQGTSVVTTQAVTNNANLAPQEDVAKVNNILAKYE